MNHLPNCENARIPIEKLVDYLLNFDHIRGSSKADYFSRFGYRQANFDEFATALSILACAGEVTEIRRTARGESFRVEGILITPDGRNPTIVSIWAIDVDQSIPRLISAYPN